MGAAGAVSATGVGGVAARLSQPASADIAAITEAAINSRRGVMVVTWTCIAISWFNEWTAIRAIDAPDQRVRRRRPGVLACVRLTASAHC